MTLAETAVARLSPRNGGERQVLADHGLSAALGGTCVHRMQRCLRLLSRPKVSQASLCLFPLYDQLVFCISTICLEDTRAWELDERIGMTYNLELVEYLLLH